MPERKAVFGGRADVPSAISAGLPPGVRWGSGTLPEFAGVDAYATSSMEHGRGNSASD